MYFAMKRVKLSLLIAVTLLLSGLAWVYTQLSAADIVQITSISPGRLKPSMRSLTELSHLLQSQITNLQHPADCSKAQVLSFSYQVDKVGFGYGIHMIILAFIVAFKTNRALHLKDVANMDKAGGWSYFFQPLEPTCLAYYRNHSIKAEAWSSIVDPLVSSVPWLHMSNDDGVYPRLSDPYAIPAFLLPDLAEAHRYPELWLVGQFTKFLFRLSNEVETRVREVKKGLTWSSPTVGIHVRRADKVSSGEAEAHSLEKYLLYVNKFYAQHAHTEKRVYLTSDEPAIFQEAVTKFGGEFNFTFADSAKKTQTWTAHYNAKEFESLIVDLVMLQSTDYVVCTFSSNFGRLVYAMKQDEAYDNSCSVLSLDDPWHITYGYGDMAPLLPKADAINCTIAGPEIEKVSSNLAGTCSGFKKKPGLKKLKDCLRMKNPILK